VHAAKELGYEGYLDLLPPAYSWWLKRREQIREISRDSSVTASGDEG